MGAAVVWAVHVSVGFCLGAAAVGKMLGLAGFTRTLRLLLKTGDRPAQILGIGVIAGECFVALYLISGAAWLVPNVIAFAWLVALVAISMVALVTRIDVPCSCFGTSAKPLGRGTLPLALILSAGQGVFVLRETIAGLARPAVDEMVAIWALGLVLIAAFRLIAVIPTGIAIVSQRRHLRGGAA